MVFSALSDDISTVSQFTRKKKITITTGGTNTPTDYQVKLTITYESEMQADFNDIRFNTRDGDYIDYWIESYTASTTATAWVELPDAITDPGSDYIYIYYGNSSLSDGGDGNDTFLFFDDFPGSSIDTNKWDGDTANTSVSGGIMSYHPTSTSVVKSISQFGADVAVRSRIKIYTGTSYINYWGVSNPAITHYARSYVNYVPQNIIYVKDGSTSNEVNSNWPLDSWYIGDLNIIGGTSVKAFADGVERTGSPVTSNPPNSSELEVEFTARDNDDIEAIDCDWILTRKNIVNEPTSSYDTAQHQRRIPQFIG